MKGSTPLFSRFCDRNGKRSNKFSTGISSALNNSYGGTLQNYKEIYKKVCRKARSNVILKFAFIYFVPTKHNPSSQDVMNWSNVNYFF